MLAILLILRQECYLAMDILSSMTWESLFTNHLGVQFRASTWFLGDISPGLSHSHRSKFIMFTGAPSLSAGKPPKNAQRKPCGNAKRSMQCCPRTHRCQGHLGYSTFEVIFDPLPQQAIAMKSRLKRDRMGLPVFLAWGYKQLYWMFPESRGTAIRGHRSEQVSRGITYDNVGMSSTKHCLWERRNDLRLNWTWHWNQRDRCKTFGLWWHHFCLSPCSLSLEHLELAWKVFQSGMKPAMQAVSTSDVFGNASTSWNFRGIYRVLHGEMDAL
jgi:hypothetical protein